MHYDETELPTNDDEVRAYAERDGGLIPCSRYVNRYGDGLGDLVVALVAIIEDATSEPVTFEGIDHLVSLIVNNHDDVGTLLVQHGPSVGIEPTDYLDPDDIEDARALIDAETNY